MEGSAESSKRPLLEQDEDPNHVALPRVLPRVDRDRGESSALLEDSGHQVSPQGREPPPSSLPTGGVLHLFQAEGAERRDALNPPERAHESRPSASSGESVVIEMHSMPEEGSRELLPVVAGVSGAATRQGDDRTCFICLQDGEKDNPLVSCCSTCYACTHRRCWREWRNNQHRTALRSHLLGLRMQTNHMLRCTICKSGTAMVEGEENGLSWMNELMCGGEPSENSLLGRLVALGNRREDSDEDPEAQLEDLIDTRTCVALVIYLGMLIVAIIIACLLIVTQGFWAGDVVLCCIIALYELSVLQLVMLAILRRRDVTFTASTSSASTGTRPAEETRESTQPVREIQLRTLG